MKSVDESLVWDVAETGFVVIGVSVEGLRPDEVSLEEFVASRAGHGANPAEQRNEEHSHQNRKRDREKREEFIKVQIHRQDALRIGEGIPLYFIVLLLKCDVFEIFSSLWTDTAIFL